MLKRIILHDYRCFEKSELSLKDISIIVGNNNAGKSTIIEALRIVSHIAQKFKNVSYFPAPLSLKLPVGSYGIYLNLESLKIDLKTIVHQYKTDVFAQIHAQFDNKTLIKVYLQNDMVFATIENNGKNISRKAEARRISDLNLFIMPQIGLIREDEARLSEDTVRKDMSTRLSSRHFRNELLLYRDDFFETFREIAQSSWPGLRITDLSFDLEENKISLLVFDADYAAEIGSMGSGLQMWLQIIWFISRCPQNSTVVLDEPDVYMHPDMQRKVLNIVKQRFNQVIIATHSVEIISGVEPDKIVTVDKKTRKMHYAGSFKAVQAIIEKLGSEYNLALTRLGSVKKCIFVEGEDVKILSKLQNIVFPETQLSLEQLPIVKLGGWSRFQEALGTARLFYEETRGEIQTYCILDRDYHTEVEIQDLYNKAKENHLNLHVWERKELENYILTPKSIYRAAKCRQINFEDFCDELFNELNQLYDQTLNAMLDEYAKRDKSKNPSYHMKQAQAALNPRWSTLEGRLSCANGKNLISLINTWIKNRFNRDCSLAKLISNMTVDDILPEMLDVLKSICF